MPELPEVENIKRGLIKKVINKKIISVEISEIVASSHKNQKRAIVKDNLEIFKKNLIGKTILDLTRRGKYLYFTLEKGYLVTHFGMTGAYFVVKEEKDIKNKNYYKHRHIIFNFETGEKMCFCDIRRFSELRYLDDISTFKPFQQMAPEPFYHDSLKKFLDKLNEKKYLNKEIKALLLDGSVFCGCGNIYACEVLYKEKINPLTFSKNLSEEDKKRIFISLKEILEFSIEKGGSTISDYVNSEGEKGNMQNYLKIYGKKVCPLGHATKNIKIKGRSTYFCPECQKYPV